MSCALCFWLFGLGSLLTGGLLTWLFTRNKSENLRQEIDIEKRKVHQLEQEYAALRTSSQSEVMSLKSKNNELKNSLAVLPTEVANDLKVKYENLKEEYDQLLAAPIIVTKDEDSIAIAEYEKLKAKFDKLKADNKELNASLSILNSETEILVDQAKIPKRKGKGKKKKRIKKLKRQVAKLEKRLKKEEKVDGIKKEIEINKSLRIEKLMDWLKSDKAYKVEKKVSTKKLKS